jgi:hypothetical protein
MKKHSALQEYVTGIKEPVLKLSTGAIHIIAIAIWFAWIALALAGVVDFFANDGIFGAEWQRIASWLAIVLLAIVVAGRHVKRMRRKGRQILDQNS